jgi:hypothetical protein
MAFPLLLLIVAAAQFVIGELLRPRPGDAIPQQPERPTIDQTRVRPFVVGNRLLKNPPILWWGDYGRTPVYEQVKILFGLIKKKFIKAWQYRYGLHLYLDWTLADSTALGLGNLYVNERFVGFLATSVFGSASFSFDIPGFFGGDGDTGQGGLKLVGTVYKPDIQTAGKDSYLVARLGNTPSYREASHIVFHGISGTSGGSYWGNNPGQVQSIWVEVSKWLGGASSPGALRFIDNGDGFTDANPADVIYNLLTSKEMFAGISPDEIDNDVPFPRGTLSDASFALYLEGLGISHIFDRSQPVEEMIAEVLRHIDGVIYTDLATGRIKMKLARKDYTESSLPVIDNNTVKEIVECRRQATAPLINRVYVTYLDRKLLDKPVTIYAENPALIAAQGRVVASDPINYPMFSSRRNAQKAAERDLRALSADLIRLTLRCDRTWSTVKIGDVYKWQDPANANRTEIIRITGVDYGELGGDIIIHAKGDVFAQPSQVVFGTVDSGWTDPQSSQALAAPNYGAIEMPYWFQREDEQHVIAYASRPNAAHTGYDLYVGGVLDTSNLDFTPTGQLTASLDAYAGGVTTTITINNVVDSNRLVSGNNYARGQGLFLIDGEILAYQNLVDNGDGSFTLQSVRRGLLDTVPTTHTTGARVWFLTMAAPEAAFSDAIQNGTSVLVEHLTKTVADMLTTSEAPDFNLGLTKRAGRPLRPAYFTVNGSYTTTTIPATGDVVLAWRSRNRLTEQDILAQDAPATPREAGTTYTLKIYNDAGTLIRTEANIAADTFTYTNAQETSDNGGLSTSLTFVLYTVRGSLTSFQAWVRQVTRPGGSLPAPPAFTPAGSYTPPPSSIGGIIAVDTASAPNNGDVLAFNTSTGQASFTAPNFLTARETDNNPTGQVNTLAVPHDTLSVASGVATYKPLASVRVDFDGAGFAIQTTIDPGALRVPFDCVIEKWSVYEVSGTAGTITIDLRRDTHANFPPDAADSICGTGTKPGIASSGVKAEGTNFSNWTTTTLNKDDILYAVVTAAATVKHVVLDLQVRRL